MKSDRRTRLLGVGVICLCSVPSLDKFIHIPDFVNGFLWGLGMVLVIAAVVLKSKD